MPIKDKRAGLVGELEETAFFAAFVQSVFFFLLEVWRHNWNLLHTIIAGRLRHQGKLKAELISGQE